MRNYEHFPTAEKRKQNIIKVAGAIFALLIIFAIGHHVGGGNSHHKKHKKVKHEVKLTFDYSI